MRFGRRREDGWGQFLQGNDGGQIGISALKARANAIVKGGAVDSNRFISFTRRQGCADAIRGVGCPLQNVLLVKVAEAQGLANSVAGGRWRLALKLQGCAHLRLVADAVASRGWRRVLVLGRLTLAQHRTRAVAGPRWGDHLILQTWDTLRYIRADAVGGRHAGLCLVLPGEIALCTRGADAIVGKVAGEALVEARGADVAVSTNTIGRRGGRHNGKFTPRLTSCQVSTFAIRCDGWLNGDKLQGEITERQSLANSVCFLHTLKRDELRGQIADGACHAHAVARCICGYDLVLEIRAQRKVTAEQGRLVKVLVEATAGKGGGDYAG